VIRGLAVGSIDPNNTKQFLRREFLMGLVLSIILATAGCIRAAVFMTPWLETFAITSSLFMIVMISVVLGAILPLGMRMVGIDPAHSSTTIQVIMDILGVTITVQVSSLLLDSNFVNWVTGWLNNMVMDARL
jgi:Mg/Co/Ni transporter MgtE